MDLRAENKAHLRAQLIARLHSRYKFLGDYASTHESKNIVNSQALLKFTKHLSSYKYMVWKMIADGKGFEEVHSAFPHVSQADFDAFVANEELQATKNRKLWGKEMRELNIGNHNLGSRGYEGKEPYWAKEDEAYVNADIENPWLKYKDPLERRFIRSRYHKKKLTGELVTDPKVIVKEETPTIAIMDPFYMRESIICNAGIGRLPPEVEDFMRELKRAPFSSLTSRVNPCVFRRDKFCTLIVVHPQHSHAVYLDSGRVQKKDYTHIKALLNDALTGFANKAGPLKVERKSRGGLVLTHTTNFRLRQSTHDNGMDAWYAIFQMQEYIKYDDMLLPENLRNRFANMADVPDREIRKKGRIQRFICTIILQDVTNRSGEFFYGYGLPPNDEIELRLEMSRDERPFNSLEGCRPFPPRRTT
ncbi:hypothetical protein QYE76_028636 [Lolium multiflorum]|uniref:Uncharacterized protein n=1 Tax=Lolium multiflorum TaxID=4521 RepID=A0AAD8QPW3_LOLMU|nr:hypothetical protein QYE76_028636 [Lolium multiflorum]